MTPNDAVYDTTPNGWLITPASNLIIFLTDEMIIAGVTERAIKSISAMPTLLSAARHQLRKSNHQAQQKMQQLIDFTKNDAEFAEAEIRDDLRRVRSHHLVATWAAIETTIEHTLRNHICRVPDADKVISANTPIKINFDPRKTMRAWQSSFPKRETLMEKQLAMLGVFGLNLVLEGDNSRLLSEISSVRNVIVHNAGFIDWKFLGECPWRSDKIGERISINSISMARYFDAANDFAIKLISAVVKSPYLKTTT